MKNLELIIPDVRRNKEILELDYLRSFTDIVINTMSNFKKDDQLIIRDVYDSNYMIKFEEEFAKKINAIRLQGNEGYKTQSGGYLKIDKKDNFIRTFNEKELNYKILKQ